MSKASTMIAIRYWALAAGPSTVAGGAEAVSLCWSPPGAEINGDAYSFEFCCRMYAPGLRGHPECWAEDFTYEVCCTTELQPRVNEALGLIGDGHYREAAHRLFDLHINYATGSGNEQARLESWHGFEKASLEFQRSLDALPSVLSYEEVLFGGFRETCDASKAADSKNQPSPLEDFERCCKMHMFNRRGCLQIYEMMSTALAAKMHARSQGEDSYYGEFSQHWAFHHFTPSIFTGGGGTEGDDRDSYDLASEINSEIASALTAGGSPRHGIVFAEHLPEYTAPQFYFGVFYLTVALDAIRRAGEMSSGGRHPQVDIFEIGAGFGTLPRLLSSARQRLIDLPAPVDVQSYTAFDLRSIIDLQRWYLRKSAEDDDYSVEVRDDWLDRGTEAMAASELLWPELSNPSPLRVDLVERDARELFVHLYSRERSVGRPAAVRLLFAVNSWHEMVMSEFLWYYRALVEPPGSGTSMDWLLYVSNVDWEENDVKLQLLLSPRSGLVVHYERCTDSRGDASGNCARLFRRRG